LDVGFNAVKVMASNGRQASFPSVIGIEQEQVMGNAVGESKKRSVIEVDGRRWAFGETALSGSEYASGRQDAEWIESQTYGVLLGAALSEVHRGTATTNVVSGLPLEDWKAYSDALRWRLIGSHGFRRDGGSRQTVHIEDAIVVTQPYGSLLDRALSDSGRILDNAWATGTVGIVDIGGNTLNLLVTDGMEEDGRWTRGDGLGLLRALDQVARAIHGEHRGITPKPREVSGWLARGWFEEGGERHEIAPYSAQYLDSLVELVLNRCASVWSEPGRYSAVLLTGGGALALGRELKRRMDRVYANVEIAPDPVFGNCRGYLKLARRLWG